MRLHALLSAALDTTLLHDFRSPDSIPIASVTVTRMPGSTVNCRTVWTVWGRIQIVLPSVRNVVWSTD
jgi:hypothetical protein